MIEKVEASLEEIRVFPSREVGFVRRPFLKPSAKQVLCGKHRAAIYFRIQTLHVGRPAKTRAVWKSKTVGGGGRGAAWGGGGISGIRSRAVKLDPGITTSIESIPLL